jgi:hypothetical protein
MCPGDYRGAEGAQAPDDCRALKVHKLQIRAGVHAGEVETVEPRGWWSGVVIGSTIGVWPGPRNSSRARR